MPAAHRATDPLAFDRGNVRTGIPRWNEWFGWRECPLGNGRVFWPVGQMELLAGDRRRLGGCAPTIQRQCRGSAGNRTLGPSARGNVRPQASPGKTNGLADKRDAPSTIARDVGPAANGHDTRRTHDVSSLGPSADADDLKLASNLTGFSVASSCAPLASDASFGHPANWSNTRGNDNVSKMGLDNVDNDVADPMGNGASGDRPLGPLTGGASSHRQPRGARSLRQNWAGPPTSMPCWTLLSAPQPMPTT
jgi:hypothetical protein